MSLKDLFSSKDEKPKAVYGYCPKCGALGVSRERRPNGNDHCENGHVYASREATENPIRREEA